MNKEQRISRKRRIKNEMKSLDHKRKILHYDDPEQEAIKDRMKELEKKYRKL